MKNKAIIFYNKKCTFCKKTKNFLKKNTKNLFFEDINSKESENIFSKNNIFLDKSSFWLLEKGKFKKKSGAIKSSIKYFRWYLKPVVIILYFLPNTFLDSLYKKLSLKVKTCSNNKKL